MSLSKPQLSVIVPVYNGTATLEAMLQGLATQTLPGHCFELIIADDCSTDDTAAILTSYARHSLFPVKILTQVENRGASAARNLAASAAQADYLVFMDADCLPEAHWLESHLTALQSQPPRSAVIGRIVWSEEFKGGSLSEYYKKLYFPDQEAVLTSGDHEYQAVPFTYFVTSNAAMPRRFFEELGGFDEDFCYLWDDTVLGYRLEKAGGKVFLNRSALVYHHRPLSPGDALGRFRRQGQEAMRLLAKYPELTGLVADPAEILTDRFHQEELYRMVARYALGVGYAEGAGRYFDTTEVEQLLERPELKATYDTWRDQRLTLYRTNLAEIQADQSRTLAYVRHLEAAHDRTQQQLTHLQAELDREKQYSLQLEQAQGFSPGSLNLKIAGHRVGRGWRRGRQALRQLWVKAKPDKR